MHNRWHPDIEPILEVPSGGEFTLKCPDSLGGIFTRESSHEDVTLIDRGVPNVVEGPVYVEEAEPGDLLEVEILALEPEDFGWTCLAPGFGFLADLFPEPYLMKWDVGPGYASSSELPGVRIPPALFPGVIGVTPSHALLSEIRRREEGLRDRGGAVAEDAPEAALPPNSARGLRTVPPREIGGNLDVRQLVAGSRIRLPVHVPGALLSFGDVHYSQGDGEVCGSALEIAAAVSVRVGVVKNPSWRPRFPVYETPPERPRHYLATTGMPITPEGRNESMDLTLATRAAMIDMIDYLTTTYGFSSAAAYCLAGVTVDLRLSEVVDVPNPCVSALVPLDIFES